MELQPTPRVLFVCSLLGARACVASYYCKQLSGGGILSFPSGFEVSQFGEKIKAFLASKGINLPEHSPKSVFERHRNEEYYDYVVTLCNDAAREQCPIFRRSVDTLFQKAKMLNWFIADFQSVEGDEAFVLDHWENIVSDIESHVREMVDMLVSAHP